MRLFENADYALIPNRHIGYVISGTLLTISVISLLVKGLALGIDFRGGMEFVVGNTTDINTVEIRSALTETLEDEPEVKRFGDTGHLIRISTTKDITTMENRLLSTLQQQFPDHDVGIEKTDVVGPRFAEDLKRGAIYAVLGALLVIFLYIMVRFEWRYSLGAVAALVHDVTITLGLFSVLAGLVPFSLQIDQSIIAAFLTIVGYSLNDTVVVFDRVREYVNLFKTEPFDEVVNRSINATLSRTVVTSVTTLIVVSILFFFGGEVLRGFSFALIIGVIIGTYSSVFVASPTIVELNRRLEKSAA
ncbi:MAG: protein translocase subunit SecF [Bacteroidetes bacterium SW_8_64_56]|jgi:preprotein translocase SecF subunit|nr:MAG: protein translocase subunit SecF [Bacteroidetes bacterium QH_1_64_81]PSQ98220.1 MAG: protein translocase subunit SecF [Bacteroidetes bacterium SW_7_64_58]PSR05427.1 MAG: protein translocase subunit SecF [Bacteroidetes bacterium SW_8_64_56]